MKSHPPLAQPTTDDDEITTTIDHWANQSVTRSDERDERRTGPGLDSASLASMMDRFAANA